VLKVSPEIQIRPS